MKLVKMLFSLVVLVSICVSCVSSEKQRNPAGASQGTDGNIIRSPEELNQMNQKAYAQLQQKFNEASSVPFGSEKIEAEQAQRLNQMMAETLQEFSNYPTGFEQHGVIYSSIGITEGADMGFMKHPTFIKEAYFRFEKTYCHVIASLRGYSDRDYVDFACSGGPTSQVVSAEKFFPRP